MSQETAIDAVQWYLIIDRKPIGRDKIRRYIELWNSANPAYAVGPYDTQFNGGIIRDLASYIIDELERRQC